MGSSIYHLDRFLYLRVVAAALWYPSELFLGSLPEVFELDSGTMALARWMACMARSALSWYVRQAVESTEARGSSQKLGYRHEFSLMVPPVISAPDSFVLTACFYS